MHELAPLIYDLAIILGLAAAVTIVFQLIKQPVVLGYLVAGMIIGPNTPPYVLISDVPNIKTLSELGVIFLMFSLGLEFSFRKLKSVGFSASITGIFEVFGMALVGYIVGILIGWSHINAIFLGAALSISSTTIIIKAIDELGLKTKHFSQLIFGILIVEDLLAILLLVALSTVIYTQNIFSLEMLVAAVKLVIVVGGWFLIGYFIVPTFFRKIMNYINQETLTIISVALCLFLVCAAARFNYSVALGAFIMGSILAETVLIHRIRELIYPIRDIFAAVFFVSVGMLIDPYIILQKWELILALSIVTIIGKISITSIGALLTGQSLSNSIRVGFGMAQIGEFSFIIIALGLTLNAIDKELYPIIVAVSGITTFTTPYLIRMSGAACYWINQRMPERLKYFLNRYSEWVFRVQNASPKNQYRSMISVRLVLNGIIVTVIFTFVDRAIYPELESWLGSMTLANDIAVLISIVLSLPFIWGMLFSYRSKNIPMYAQSALTPTIFMVWFFTLAELALLSIFYFHTWITVAFFAFAGIGFLFLAYKYLERSYHWFEKQLVDNIQMVDENQVRYEALAPWDTHLVEVEVGELSPFVGNTLRECQILERYHVNVVAISHGARLIPAPHSNEKIMPYDKLIVLGRDENIETFRKDLEMRAPAKKIESLLDYFSLRTFFLNEGHPFIGKTIHSLHLKEKVRGTAVGLERNNSRILNPSAQTILQKDDLLIVVGETSKLDELAAE